MEFFAIDINPSFEDDGKKIKIEVVMDVLDIPMVYDIDPTSEPDERVVGGILFAAYNAVLRGEFMDRGS